jgi:peptide/nickel transport system permease protein
MGVKMGHNIRDIGKNRGILTGGVIIVLLAILAIFAPFIAPNDPAEQNLEKYLSPPSLKYPLGTDQFGRCMLSRLIYGIRTSLGIASVVTVIVVITGLAIGMISGYYSRIDDILMRITDSVLGFPGIVLALVIVSILGPGISSIIIALSVPGWAKYARVVRGSVLSIKEKEFIESARAIGSSDFHILFRHILPNCIAPVITIATIGVGGKIISIAGLGFLGLGVQPPTPEWGSIMSGGLPLLHSAPHIAIFSGLMIALTVMAFTLLGDGLRDALDPRLTHVMIK